MNTKETKKALIPFSVNIDEELDSNLNTLKKAFRKQSKADVFRLSIALLNIAAKAQDDGLLLAVVNEKGGVFKEIILA